VTVPDELLDMLRGFERLRLNAYLCPAGVWTIGYGATGPEIGPGLVWTEEEADARLQRDAAIAFTASQRLCPALSGDPLIAIADFCFNLGATRLKASTLRRKVNAGDMAGDGEEIERWVYGGGIKLGGLVTRRKVEKAMLLAS